MEVNKKLVEFRKQYNITQEQLAEKLGVARQTISKWELGETSPDLEQAKKLSQIFNVSLDELTDNDLKSVIVAKLNTTEKLMRLIINILKIILLVIIILVILGISTIFFREYFSVQPVSTMQSIECVIDGHDYSYQVVMNNDTPYILDELITNDKELDIDVFEYINFEDIFKDIRDSVTSRGGVCR